jgi:hypothetical protein
MSGQTIAIAKFLLSITWIVLWGAAQFAFADGGVVRFSERRGGLLVTVFTSPAPLRVGPADVSILVQDADTGQPSSSGLALVLLAHPANRASDIISAPATADAATNKLLRAARFEFTAAGRWHVDVVMPALGRAAPIGFDVDVAEPLPSWLHLAPWIAWPFALIGLFVIHQFLAHRRGDSRTPAIRRHSASRQVRSRSDCPSRGD